MALDIKQHGRVYMHIVEAVESNFGKYTLPWKYDKTKNAILKATLVEYNADRSYPIQLQEALSDVVLRWCVDGYPQTDKEDITAIFHALWAFHKKWLLTAEINPASKITQAMNKDATDIIANLCGGINSSLDRRKEKITDLFVVVMEHVIVMAKNEDEDE